MVKAVYDRSKPCKTIKGVLSNDSSWARIKKRMYDDPLDKYIRDICDSFISPLGFDKTQNKLNTAGMAYLKRIGW